VTRVWQHGNTQGGQFTFISLTQIDKFLAAVEADALNWRREAPLEIRSVAKAGYSAACLACRPEATCSLLGRVSLHPRFKLPPSVDINFLLFRLQGRRQRSSKKLSIILLTDHAPTSATTHLLSSRAATCEPSLRMPGAVALVRAVAIGTGVPLGRALVGLVCCVLVILPLLLKLASRVCLLISGHGWLGADCRNVGLCLFLNSLAPIANHNSFNLILI